MISGSSDVSCVSTVILQSASSFPSTCSDSMTRSLTSMDCRSGFAVLNKALTLSIISLTRKLALPMSSNIPFARSIIIQVNILLIQAVSVSVLQSASWRPKTTIWPDKTRFNPPNRSSSEPRSARAAQTGARCPGGGRMACRRTSERGATAQRFVKSRARRSHLRSKQHNVRTVLSVVRKGRMWRVQITRPNGCVRYFGRFSSPTRARDWIAAHACLINPVS
jgi:hypothetical protein